jgi:hypothetical protein
VDNPFLKRATERLRDEEAFLSLVSPEPVTTFFGEYGRTGQLYDRLILVRGAPGCGKTTLARLFQYQTIAALLRNRDLSSFKALMAALADCGAIRDECPAVLACRLSMESDYRETWEFPYPEELRISLLTTLIQARAVLAWLRNLRVAGVDPDVVQLVPKDDAIGAVETIGGTSGTGVLERAKTVELALYKIAGALIAPDMSLLEASGIGAYRPFDIIDHFMVETDVGGVPRRLELRPLLILDDAHTLHQAQFRSIEHWLVRRELRLARWILTRLDILTPRQVLSPALPDSKEVAELPGIIATRDRLDVWLQTSMQDRRENRTSFRRMAKDMAARYLRQMPLFATRDLVNLGDILSTEPAPGTPAKVRDLSQQIDANQQQLAVTPSRRALLEDAVNRYAAGSKSLELTGDVRLAVLSILMYRYANRIPQESLFSQEEDPEPSRPLVADSGVLDAARLHLLHSIGRPFFYGIDTLCDASSENAEQFLRLASLLVEQTATQITRSKPPSIDAETQNRLLRERAAQILEQWSFPYHALVRRVTHEIATRCLKASLERNAWLGPGANAYGVRAAEFARIPTDQPELARVLQFGIAYSALTLIPNYLCKDEEWCLLELGGTLILHYGLTLKRGGFLEGTVNELARIIQTEEQ